MWRGQRRAVGGRRLDVGEHTPRWKQKWVEKKKTQLRTRSEENAKAKTKHDPVMLVESVEALLDGMRPDEPTGGL